MRKLIKENVLPQTTEEKKAIYLGCITMFILLLFIGLLTYSFTVKKSLVIKEKAHAESQYARV
jgi:hypothetical protein